LTAVNYSDVTSCATTIVLLSLQDKPNSLKNPRNLRTQNSALKATLETEIDLTSLHWWFLLADEYISQCEARSCHWANEVCRQHHYTA